MDGLFHGKPQLKWDDLGGQKNPYFWKHPYDSELSSWFFNEFDKTRGSTRWELVLWILRHLAPGTTGPTCWFGLEILYMYMYMYM